VISTKPARPWTGGRPRMARVGGPVKAKKRRGVAKPKKKGFGKKVRAPVA